MAKKRATWLGVVTALIRQNDKILVGCRPEAKSLPGVWEFPGGKIEIGEAPDEALKRELSEELGIDAEIGPLLFATTHNYSDLGLLILFYEVLYWKGQIKPIHHTDLKWVSASELKNLELPEANRKVLDKILTRLK